MSFADEMRRKNREILEQRTSDDYKERKEQNRIQWRQMFREKFRSLIPEMLDDLNLQAKYGELGKTAGISMENINANGSFSIEEKQEEMKRIAQEVVKPYGIMIINVTWKNHGRYSVSIYFKINIE